MPKTTESAKLILHPANIHNIPGDVNQLIQSLHTLGLIKDIQLNNDIYLPGGDFLNLITFLGCSPSINLSPEEGDNFCSIRFSDIEQQAVCLGYSNSIQPKCPNCKKKISHWQLNNDWHHADALISCKNCRTESQMHSLKWRHEAGYGRYQIIIDHIFPHEAVPAESLLTGLKQATGFEWQYFYSQNTL